MPARSASATNANRRDAAGSRNGANPPRCRPARASRVSTIARVAARAARSATRIDQPSGRWTMPRRDQYGQFLSDDEERWGRSGNRYEDDDDDFYGGRGRSHGRFGGGMSSGGGRGQWDDDEESGRYGNRFRGGSRFD